MIVVERVKERMKACGLSQAELARRVGVAQPTIFKVVHGSSYATRHLHRIARELGTTPAYLTGETDDPDSDTPSPPEVSAEEELLINKWRLLTGEDRRVVEQLLERLISPRTLHAPRLAYRPPTGAEP